MQLPSRYKLVDSKGSGGFGEVIHLMDEWLNRDVAVKILDPVMALDEADRKRFRQEARILAKMSHPAIPAIYDVVFKTKEESEGDVPYFHIFFEYIAGQNLHQHLQSEGPAPLQTVQAWFLQLASALHHAHHLGIVHRDVKPKNIIIRMDQDTCCLVDFGIALTKDEAERFTASGYVIGTPGYMSPEQQAGATVDHRTDIYSLGVCLYEALSGSPVPQGEYKSLSIINEVIPQAVDDLVQECMKPIDERIPDARTFMQRLISVLRTRRPLSKVLAEGRLSDLDAVLSDMVPAEFADRPAGQRELIIQKVMSIAESGDDRLEFPTLSLLATLIHLGTHLSVEQYSEILDVSLHWGFDRIFANEAKGDKRLRRAMAGEASQLPRENHRNVVVKVLEYFSSRDLNDYDEWQLNGLRELISNLMANRHCDGEDEAGNLAGLLRKLRHHLRGRKVSSEKTTTTQTARAGV